ncbi:FimG family fimbrial adaptor subunit [Buttiauxella brennerae ATCC 51605]|jgi:minor fimbrial subunit|uniref:FimG family fimbrial adaptor subunit n=1 Tax=Buttiauxella brennerae ATCC 51605 TaxID=1354251 RepID=A0A1B7IQ21_9ENTR|nr:fimbrial protein [Buttiauxella brennerae]OAT31837.1 FimG family fimbrial adaptor subunit [Buttiauxella brennerae ATCC 51605]
MREYGSLFILPLVLLVGPSNAEDISIEGRIVSTPCSVDVDTQDKLINFGRVANSTLSPPNQGSRWNNFELVLLNCAAYLQQATATLSGTPDIIDPTAFKNRGNAINVALRLTNTDHSVIYQNESQMTVPVDGVTHKAVFPMSARIISPLQIAGAGTFRAVVNVSFTYQ